MACASLRWLLAVGAFALGCDSDPDFGTPCTDDSFCGDGICRGGLCAPRTAPAMPDPTMPLPRTPTCTGGLPPGGGAEAHSVGDCAEAPWSLDTDANNGVVIDPSDGAITLNPEGVNNTIIWIANTEEGTVSKFDTRTYEELARYRTGSRGREDDPSRTSVNTFGDVYVGNREGGSVTKISVLGDRCPDTNGDGTVTTSSGGDDVLPWGQDDCVLWQTELSHGGLIRSVAAQDPIGLDGVIFSVVWIGGYDGYVWQLDGDTGEVLIETESPVQPYGFALDRAGNLWISSREGRVFGRLDTNRCTDNASCMVPICDEDDTCVKERIEVPIVPYGITVDPEQRVWLGGNDIVRYDPMAPRGSRITEVGLPFGDEISVHGIAADGAGWVWGAGYEHGVVRVDADSPTDFVIVDGTAGYPNKGMAVDSDGKVWSITQSDRAIVVTPGPTLMDATVDTEVARTIVDPYTYSDMTGQQLRLATNPRGYYRRIFQSCRTDVPAVRTTWVDLHWDGDAPPGTRLSFRARTANTAAELAGATWVAIATVPPEGSPQSISMAFAEAGVTPGFLLEVEAQLERLETASSETLTPRVRWMEASFSCNESLI